MRLTLDHHEYCPFVFYWLQVHTTINILLTLLVVIVSLLIGNKFKRLLACIFERFNYLKIVFNIKTLF